MTKKHGIIKLKGVIEMTIQDELKLAVNNLNDEQAKIILNVIYQFKLNNIEEVEPDEWEIEAINEWNNMTSEEKRKNRIPLEVALKELGLE